MDINPPRFVISVNNSDQFHFSYTRYIENKIREFFGFEGTPIDIELRSRKSIFKNKEKDLDHMEGEKEDSDKTFAHNKEKKEVKKYKKKTGSKSMKSKK